MADTTDPARMEFGKLGTAQVGVRHEETRALVSLSGELDIGCADNVREALLTVQAPEVRIDLAQLRFIDSTGLRVLLAVHQEASKAERSVVYVRPSGGVQRILELSGLQDVLPIDRA